MDSWSETRNMHWFQWWSLAHFSHKCTLFLEYRLVGMWLLHVHQLFDPVLDRSDASLLNTVTAPNVWPRPVYCRPWRFSITKGDMDISSNNINSSTEATSSPPVHVADANTESDAFIYRRLQAKTGCWVGCLCAWHPQSWQWRFSRQQGHHLKPGEGHPSQYVKPVNLSDQCIWSTVQVRRATFYRLQQKSLWRQVFHYSPIERILIGARTCTLRYPSYPNLTSRVKTVLRQSSNCSCMLVSPPSTLLPLIQSKLNSLYLDAHCWQAIVPHAAQSQCFITCIYTTLPVEENKRRTR